MPFQQQQCRQFAILCDNTPLILKYRYLAYRQREIMHDCINRHYHGLNLRLGHYGTCR